MGALPGAVGYSKDLLVFRYIELDRTVRSSLFEGERERPPTPGAQVKIVLISLDTPGIREISLEEEAEIWEARGVHPEGAEE